MNEKELAELREHFDTADLSDDINAASWDATVEPDPMLVTSLRLPKSLLDWVRAQADAERVKPTALIRRWIEDRRCAGQVEVDATLAGLAARVDRLESVTLHVAKNAPSRSGDVAAGVDEEGAEAMTDLLEALRRSVEAVRGSSQDVQHRRGA